MYSPISYSSTAAALHNERRYCPTDDILFIVSRDLSLNLISDLLCCLLTVLANFPTYRFPPEEQRLREKLSTSVPAPVPIPSHRARSRSPPLSPLTVVNAGNRHRKEVEGGSWSCKAVRRACCPCLKFETDRTASSADTRRRVGTSSGNWGAAEKVSRHARHLYY